MRKLVGLSLAVLLLVALVGCAGASSSAAPPASADAPAASTPAADTESAPAADGEKQVLRVAGESWQVSKIFLEEAAKIYEDAHPDVDVQIVTYADTSVLATYNLNWAQGNTDADIVFLDGGVTFAIQFDAKDLIFDFEKELDIFANYDASKLRPGVLDYGRVNGNLIDFPIIYEVYGVTVNRAMFEAAGLVDENGEPLPVETWDDFYDFAQQLTLKDANGVITQEGASIQFGNNLLGCISAALAAQNGNVMAADGVSYDIDNQAFTDIVANWQRGVVDGYYTVSTFADNAAARNASKAGTLAMCFESAGRWMESEQMLGAGTMSVLPVPGGQGTYGFGGGVVVPKCSPVPELACSFITEVLLGEYVQTNTFLQYGKMSVVSEYFDQVIVDLPTWDNLSESMKNALMPPTYQEQQKLLDGTCLIFQAGMVDASITPESIVADLVELMNSVQK